MEEGWNQRKKIEKEMSNSMVVSNKNIVKQ